MASAPAWAPQPFNVEGRPVAGRPSIFINTGDTLDNPNSALAQYNCVPRIIALHWLRPEPTEANDD
jgi:hypothetical protein